MKNKLKLCLLLIACVMIISVSTVSATNVTSFKEMNTEIQAGNNVTLTKDIKGLDGINDGITINGKITVDGNGHSIDAQGKGRFFNIGSTGELTLKNIALKNGKKTHGGAIYNNGKLIVSDSSFIKNTVDGKNAFNSHVGGAIYNKGILTIKKSNFKDNFADGSGGAIYNRGTLTIKSSTFQNNFAKGSGGAIYNRGTLNITSSTFNNNKANSEGGAIYAEEGTLNIISSIFIQNNARKGGAIHSEYTITCINSTFSNNQAENGGAIYSLKGVCVKYCNFTENKVDHNGIDSADGGAIFCQDLNECVGCNFIKNNAENGGAIAIMDGVGTYTVQDCIFKENTAEALKGGINGKGGAIFVEDIETHIHLIHNQWINNYANNKAENVYNYGYYDDKIEHNYCEGKECAFFEHKYFARNIQRLNKDNNPCHTIEEWYKYKTNNNVLTSINKDIENNNSNKTFSNMSNSFTDSISTTTSLQVLNPTFNMSKPFNSSTGTPRLPDENNCFEMIIKSNRGTNYDWIIDNDSTHGVKLINTYVVDKNPEGLCGGEITNHFVFHIIDKDYFVRLNLIEASTGKIEDTVTSDMVN